MGSLPNLLACKQVFVVNCFMGINPNGLIGSRQVLSCTHAVRIHAACATFGRRCTLLDTHWENLDLLQKQPSPENAPEGDAAPDAGSDMRERIQYVAQELLVKVGVRGCTFGDIAEKLQITRANVHYHFGSKSDLIDAVIARYISEVTERFRSVWVNEAMTVAQKVEATIALNRARYEHFNANGGGQGWSLITRMRGEEDALSAESSKTVHQFSKDLADAVLIGLNQAIQVGELRSDAPAQEICVQLVNIINCAGLTTMDALDFSRLEAVYRSFLRMLLAAYGQARVSGQGHSNVGKSRVKKPPAGL